ncbi:MAG: oxygenase MpaB family protein [Minicystis sp.]
MPPTRFTNLDAARARFGDRVDRLAPYFSRLDPAADAVVESFAALPPGRGFALLDRALSRGIDGVPEAPPALRALFAEIDHVPPWVDWDALDRGGELLMRAGPFGGMVLGAMSIVLGYASPAGNKPLVLSGRLKEQAARRLNETSRFVQAVCRPGGMRRGADGFHITVKVRLMHAEVRRMILRSGRWDEARWGAPINQHDMSATTLLFSLVVLEGLRKLGLQIERDEAEAYVQLWRYVGRVIGCDPELTPASELQSWQLAELIRETQGAPDDDARSLTAALFNSPLTVARTPAQMRNAKLQRQIGRALARGLLGDDMADALGVPRTPLVHMVKVIRRVNAAAERVRVRVPAAHRAAVQSGLRYWDRVVEIGLAGATAEFRPPERLAIAA